MNPRSIKVDMVLRERCGKHSIEVQVVTEPRMDVVEGYGPRWSFYAVDKATGKRIHYVLLESGLYAPELEFVRMA